MFECFKFFAYQILKAYVLLQCFLKSCTWQICFAHAQSKSSVNRFNWAEGAECVMTLWNSPCLEIPPAGVPLARWPLVLKTGGGLDSRGYGQEARGGTLHITSQPA